MPNSCRFSALRVSKDKGNLRQTLQDLQADLFLNFEDNLERIKELYEENKDSPPITHNAPTVASALLWIRQLIQKIEDPMKIFRENKLLMSNRVRFLVIQYSLFSHRLLCWPVQFFKISFSNF